MNTKIITIVELHAMILAKTNGGRTYYEHVITDLEEVSVEKLQSSSNPLLNGQGTINVYKQGNQWVYSYEDRNGNQFGDVFGLCARINGLNRNPDLVKVCSIMDKELNLGLSPYMEIKIKTDKTDDPDGIPVGEMKQSLLPQISSDIYFALPPFLKKLLDIFDYKQDKDILLLSLLTVFSGCFPKLYGEYARKKIHFNIYTFIVGAASVGKSVARWSRVIMEDIEKDYDLQQKMLFFPADVSFAALIENLAKNDGKGIIFAFEADALTQNFTKEWGNITSLLRQSFEHETYDNMRKGEIGKPSIINSLKKPALSILLTGTPNQVIKLISDTEDGLFSRFNFFKVELDPAWKGVFPDTKGKHSDSSFDELLIPFKKTAYEIFQAYKKSPIESIIFEFTKEQKSRLNAHYSAMSDKYKAQSKINAIATIRRQGMICFRIAGVLTAIRMYEKPAEPLICSNEDFNTAIALSSVLMHHAFSIARQLPGSYKKQLYGQKLDFYNKLPQEFDLKTAEKVGQVLGMNKDLVEKYLKDLQPDYIVHIRYNLYRKVV